jgi:internalin A
MAGGKLSIRDLRNAVRDGALDLRGRGLTELPREVGDLSDIVSVDLSNNRLVTLPPEFGCLRTVRSLELGQNQLRALPPVVIDLPHLEVLVVDDNGLISLPSAIGRLRRLIWLGASNTGLESLPSAIGDLTELGFLDLSHNRLTRVPVELADLLDRGVAVDLSGNPLEDPLPELVARGPQALATYLRSLGDSIPLREAKVVFVGEGNVGKSSLRSALNNEPFVAGRETTHGIEIQPLQLTHPQDSQEMLARVWDFGGQEVYRITHQFFFSRRALYVVVWNPREGQEQNEVEGWLRRIRLRVGTDARVLVVATHCDERRPELDYPSLRKTFPTMLVDESPYAVDNCSGTGVADLRDAIAAQAAELPQMNQPLSQRWIAARDEVMARADGEPQIPYEEFVAICHRHRITDDREVTTLVELLHDLGQLIYYGDDDGLRDTVVLNPEWLTKAIGYVLEDQSTRDSQGVLEHARLKEIWHAKAYPSRYYPYFLRLMEKFDVSYRLHDDERRSLVAQLVPHQRPALAWDFDTPLDTDQRRLALTCQLAEPAPGLIAWLTVRHHRASTGRYWRAGVFLRHPIGEYDSEALLELHTDRRLAVEVRAPSPDLYFNVLRDSIENLIRSRWPGLTYELSVPCPTERDNRTQCPGQFELSSLLGARERDIPTWPCGKCFQQHDISALLTGFTPPKESLKAELEQVQRKLDQVHGFAADAAATMRRVLNAVGTEVQDCPRLFTLTAERPGLADRLKFTSRGLRLTLWCEQPGHWHPWPEASYEVRQPKEWLVTVAPYARIVLQTLRVAVPVTGAVAEVVLPRAEVDGMKAELELMKTLVSQIPVKPEQPEFEFSPGGLAAPQGAALRAVRQLLLTLDQARGFGDLRRVVAPAGEFLWVCPKHYPEYDPGLPTIA